jgi:uncharacterized membrane protein YbaN (DUF454 family)
MNGSVTGTIMCSWVCTKFILTPQLCFQAGESTLHSVLNHLAYVNKAALPNESASTRRKKKVQKVLNATYITALLGLMLCVADIGMLCGLYGLMTLVRYPTGMSPVSMLQNHCWGDNFKYSSKNKGFMWTGFEWLFWIWLWTFQVHSGKEILKWLINCQPQKKHSVLCS